MNAKNIEQIADILHKFDLTRIEYEYDGARIVLEKQPALVAHGALYAGVPAAANAVLAENAASQVKNAAHAECQPAKEGATKSAEPAATPDNKVVEAPLTGIAYRTKEPGVPPFVEVGSVVQEGDVLCLIEAMKMFSEVKANFAGTVAAIHFESDSLVEKGAPLVTLA